jgi:hypothetical protein
MFQEHVENALLHLLEIKKMTVFPAVFELGSFSHLRFMMQISIVSHI